MNLLRRIFLNEHVMMAIIVINAAVIYLQTDHFTWPWLAWVDWGCTLLFITEMIIKHLTLGVKGYWQDGWNRMDGILVIVSLPSLVAPFVDASVGGMGVVLAFRLLRVLKFFRVMHFFPNFGKIVSGFRLALRESSAVLASFAVIVVIFGMINCSLFGDIAPEYFGTPLDAIYAVFRLFTVEGWYEIPDAIAAASTPAIGHIVKLYFVLLLLGGGIIGMSFINSVFVDAMAEDNNDDVKYQLREMEAKIDRLMEMQEKKEQL